MDSDFSDNYFIFYLFDCASSQLQHLGSSIFIAA